MKLKIFMIVLYTSLALFLFLIFLPSSICCGGSYKLSKSEYKEAIEQAKLGNDTAMYALNLHHYLHTKNYGMSSYYDYKTIETRHSLSSDEYKQLLEYAKDGNETAKERLKWHNDIPQHKQEIIYNYFNNDTKAMQNFLGDCSLDDFCKSSDIYEYYSQKAKNISENKTK
jgi:hypothetical protein